MVNYHRYGLKRDFDLYIFVEDHNYEKEQAVLSHLFQGYTLNGNTCRTHGKQHDTDCLSLLYD